MSFLVEKTLAQGAEKLKGEDQQSWGAVGPEAAALYPGEQQTSSKVPEALRPALPV